MSDDKSLLLGVVKDLGVTAVVPEIYKDAVKPAAKQIGKGLETVAKTINIALAPLSGLVWGYDKIREHLEASLAEKLYNKQESEIISPAPNIAGPLLESLRYTGYDEDLRELFTNLLASSMDIDKLRYAHPAFVDIIKQLTADEAKILKYISDLSSYPIIHEINNDITDGIADRFEIERYFTGLCKQINITDNKMANGYKDNLERLRLIKHDFQEITRLEIKSDGNALAANSFVNLPAEEWDEYESIYEDKSREQILRKIKMESLWVTDLGHLFIAACVW
ncbi:DUF4393 domain-containing protein [Geomonas azotofigens]|uniref:DUF4393 domain-containing protein n=1 Tax=Geomonas azotofigens TaxID=2843196 RepID=UPI001C10484C|nr:DUF4393 domain-containing protein [Geomonas azotofigens]MBU5612176.1 DUF4393 domain-containing protein [Geomonas azotofigens]